MPTPNIKTLPAIWATSASPSSGGSSKSFGFRQRRVSGSHYIYTHPQVPRPLSLQPRNLAAKPYQISQFLDIFGNSA
jgi:hypothetical protein